MNLHEYQAKQLFAYYGLPIPKGYLCNTSYAVEEAASKIGSGPWVAKCQIHAGGRSKAGGVKIIKTKKEIYEFAERWLGNHLVTHQTNTNGQPVNQILVEEVINIERELYLGIIIDCSSHRVVFMASNKGGVEIEKVAEQAPHLIHTVIIDPLTGPMPYQGRELAFKLGLKSKLIKQFTRIFVVLVTIFLKRDLSLIEINPLVITPKDHLICLDSKLNADNNALFRQSNLQKMRDQSQEDYRVVQAAQWKLKYISLDGNIGCMVNGAGLAMSIMDIIILYGGKPANFLDVGGSVTIEGVAKAFKIILSEKNVKTVLVSIFGGIVRCDLIANGIINAIKELNINIPIFVHFEGNNAKLGVKKLSDSRLNISLLDNITDAARQAVITARKDDVHLN